MWVIQVSEGLYFESLQNGQHLGTHKRDFAKKFATRKDAAEFAVVNGLTAGARPVPVWEDEQREKR